jgi:hypothetical protein
MSLIDNKKIHIKNKYPNLVIDDNVIDDYYDFEKNNLVKIFNLVHKYENDIAKSYGLIKNDFEYESLKKSRVHINYINKKYPHLSFLKSNVKKKLYSNFIKLLNDLNKDITELIEKKIVNSNVQIPVILTTQFQFKVTT